MDNQLTAEGLTVECLQDPELKLPRLVIAAPQAVSQEPDSVDRRHRRLALTVGLRMLANRLNQTITAQNVPLAANEAEIQQWLQGVEVVTLQGQVRQTADISEALNHLVSQWHQALERGFDETEFGTACYDLRKAFCEKFIERLRKPCAATANTVIQGILQNEVYESPEDELNRVRSELRGLNSKECHAALAAAWKQPTTRVLVMGPQVPDSPDALIPQIQAAWKSKLEPRPTSAPIPPLTIAPFGTPGQLVEQRLMPGAGYFAGKFSNQAIVQLKPLAGLGGMVQVRVDVGWGNLGLPPNRSGMEEAADLMTIWYPLEGWPEKRFRAALSGRELEASCVVRQDRITWHGTTDRASLEEELQLLCACLIRPGIAKAPELWIPGKAEQTWIKSRQEKYRFEWNRLEHLMSGGDPRFDHASTGFMETDSTQVAQWLVPIFQRERLKITLVGDFAPEAALASLVKTFGTLPAREPWDSLPNYPPTMAAPADLQITLPSNTRNASVVLALPMPPVLSAGERLHQELLSSLLRLRVRKVFREISGESYSPNLFIRAFPTPGQTWRIFQIPCAQEATDEVRQRLRKLLAEFLQNGWTNDEYIRAARPLAAIRALDLRDPNWWFTAMEQPFLPEGDRAYDEALLTKLQPAVRAILPQSLELKNAIECIFKKG